MKRILAAAAVFALFAAHAAAQPPTIIEAAQRATVKIEVPTTNANEVYFCTGVKIGIVRVLTATHCIPPNGTDIQVDGVSGARVIKRTEDSGPSDGLILLEVPPQHGPLMKLAEREPPAGDETTTLGYVDRAGTKVVLRRWVAGYGVEEADKIMAVDGFLIFGMSGGPIINAKGELIGINQAVAPPGVGLATRLKVIKEFLK